MSQLPLCAIVGSGPGVSLAVARRFAASGHRLALFSRNGAAAEVAALKAEGFEVSGHMLDCSAPAAVNAALGSLGPVQVLVYNTATITRLMPLDLAPSQLVADFTVGVASALAAAQAVASTMPSGGSILFTGGGLALRPQLAVTAVGIVKAGIRNLAFSLAEALRPQGVRVGTVTICGYVSPGSAFDPDAIAASYLDLHEDRAESLGVEIMYQGRNG